MVLFLLAALHLSIATHGKALKDKIFGYLIIAFLIHSVAIFPVFLFGRDALFIETAAPFSLSYGVLLFFWQKADFYGKINKNTVLLHVIPVLLFWIFYFVFIADSSFRETIGIYYYIIVFSAVGLSLLGYGGYLIFAHFKFRPKYTFLHLTYPLFLLSGIFMLLFTLSLFGKGLGEQDRRVNMNIALYMLMPAMLIFAETFRRFRQQFIATEELNIFKQKKVPDTHKKTKIKPTLSEYPATRKIEQLNSFFTSNAIQESDLTLKSLAKQLDFTQKDIKELISEEYKTTFSKLLTTKRIELACLRLISDSFDGSYDKIVATSGFRSHASFYRNFKDLKGCSPMEYRNEFLKKNDTLQNIDSQ